MSRSKELEAARAAGKEKGQSMAEAACLDIPFHALPEMFGRRLVRKTWLDEAPRQREYHGGFRSAVPGAEAAYDRAYADEGVRWTRAYLEELKEDGLMKEVGGRKPARAGRRG